MVDRGVKIRCVSIPGRPTLETDYVLAALFTVMTHINQSQLVATQHHATQSPWYQLLGWQNNLSTTNNFYFSNHLELSSDEPVNVTVEYTKDKFTIRLNESAIVRG